jgi:hypothetical protein
VKVAHVSGYAAHPAKDNAFLQGSQVPREEVCFGVIGSFQIKAFSN